MEKGEDPLSKLTDSLLKDSMLMTEMFWDHVDAPFGNDDYSLFRIMMNARS